MNEGLAVMEMAYFLQNENGPLRVRLFQENTRGKKGTVHHGSGGIKVECKPGAFAGRLGSLSSARQRGERNRGEECSLRREGTSKGEADLFVK